MVLEKNLKGLLLMGKFSDFLGILARLARVFSERFDKTPIDSLDMLARFVRTRAAYVAQESLYGYLKTRMGTKFPQYFQDAEFSRSIRSASLKLYVSCLSDLTVFAAATVSRSEEMDSDESAALARDCFGEALREGFAVADNEPVPENALAEFDARLERTLWANAAQGENAFMGSAKDIIAYAPVIDEFKRLDGTIESNSIRFRWRDVREQFRRRMDGAGILRDRRRAHE